MDLPEHIYSFFGHASLADTEFRIWVCTDPMTAAASVGITLTEIQADYIKNNVSRRRLHGVAAQCGALEPLPRKYRVA